MGQHLPKIKLWLLKTIEDLILREKHHLVRIIMYSHSPGCGESSGLPLKVELSVFVH